MLIILINYLVSNSLKKRLEPKKETPPSGRISFLFNFVTTTNSYCLFANIKNISQIFGVWTQKYHAMSTIIVVSVISEEMFDG
jgi:hypothetical protein